MDRITYFVDVLLPLPVPELFTYRVPYELNNSIQKWKRVVVQFGKKKIYTAVVVNIHQIPPKNYHTKYILSILDEKPVMNDIQYSLWKWISDYYMCETGEVMNVAFPSALKLASESRIVMNPSFDGDTETLNEKEYLITEALDIQKQLTLTEVENIVEQKKVIPIIKGLIEKNVVLVEEELKEKYKPKIEKYIRLSEKYNDEKELQLLFDKLEKKAFKQLEVLMAYISLSGFGKAEKKDIKNSALTHAVNSSASAILALTKKGVFESYKKQTSRLINYTATQEPDDIIFSDYQKIAIDEIHNSFKENDVALFHGVTSSGKTEVYIKLIDEALKKGKQVLYLLPEIALTTQIINRLKKYFGSKVGVYHSKYNEQERVEIWNSVLNSNEKSRYRIILGPRSALFLPYSNLGLIIVDEEHDQSYKQFSPTPRYNARDSAVYLGFLHQTKVLLGSATPALESYFNAKHGKYALIELSTRYGGVNMPEILIADLRTETKRRTMKSHFSSLLIDSINDALAKNEQIILFQNRRGFSLRLECDTCHWVPECKNCDVTLIYHKHNNQLRCHYCGYSRRVPEKCDSCGSPNIQMKGFGTEKVEEELQIIFPEVTIKRMDLDTTRTKHAYQNIINDFEERRIDILVGTQMVTKGLDFDNVSIVGILNADNMINFPNFRAYERSYQLMAQVSGRAGRKMKQGKVIIQTYNPKHSVLKNVIEHDYYGMYSSQILERRNFKYPPFFRLIEIQLKHKDPRVLNEAAREFAILLRQKLGKRILGPEYPLISRIKNLYLKNVLIKLEKDLTLNEHKNDIRKAISEFRTLGNYKSVRIQVDVDPL